MKNKEKTNKYTLYEKEKEVLKGANLSSAEYEKAIIELARRLKV